MDRYICIHGHFYQPPRENAWLEAIELQDSAYPYHDWNERITAECYARNAASRILDDEGWIEQIVNNYSRISFNFGPTLLAWMAAKSPDVYEAILEADRESINRFDGHGSAMAQAYNHLIMPLCNEQDKKTQVIWGIWDFEYRFGRKPEGMWLPETAVDIPSLEALAAHDIRFTILAPHQAGRVRPLSGGEWQNVENSSVDITMPYLQRLPSGREIAIFFYDGPISRAVAFEGILNSGEEFAARVMQGFIEDREGPQLAHIATDGESYGHHHTHGDMALAYALQYIESNDLAELINYAAYLERHPPTYEVEIYENTSWSCAHGIERWQSDCGCHSGGHPGWNQGWRAPLRESLDWLRDILIPAYEKNSAPLLADPWAARNNYIEVLRDRSPESLDRFFDRHAAKRLTDQERIDALKLLEIQRHALLMYTSCGWFFDELSGIETVQVIQYAGRAIQLAQHFCGEVLEPGFLEVLQKAHSNIPEHGDGRQIFENFVKPAMVDLQKVAAHYAISSMFEEYDEVTDIYCYEAGREETGYSEAGRARLTTGIVSVTSRILLESAVFEFGVLHLGDHSISCGVRSHQDRKKYDEMVKKLFAPFETADFPNALRVLDHHFPEYRSSLTTLFQDEQRNILDLILGSTLENIVASYRHIYDAHAPLAHFLRASHNPVPKALYHSGEVVLNADLRRAFEAEEINGEEIDLLLNRAQHAGIELDRQTLEYTLRKTLERLAFQLLENPEDIEILARLESAVGIAKPLPISVELRKMQDICSEIRNQIFDPMKEKAKLGKSDAKEWLDRFRALCELLILRIE